MNALPIAVTVLIADIPNPIAVFATPITIDSIKKSASQAIVDTIKIDKKRVKKNLAS